MNLNEFSFLANLNPWLFIKIGILIGLVLYIFFAALLNRQVTLMNQILEANFSPFLKLIALIHLIWVLTLFVIALVFL